MFENLSKIIQNHHNFVITSHVNPDGDSIGSESGLYKYLANRGKKARVINHSPTPDNYRFMDTDNAIEEYSEAEHKEAIHKADVIFILDTNEYLRLRSVSDAISGSSALKVCIDHHQGFIAKDFDYGFIDIESPATAMILFRFFEEDSGSVTPEIASSLYTGIMTDTGSFRFPRTNAETLRIASKLIEYGADAVSIANQVYSNASYSKLKLLSIFLNNLKLESEGRLGYSFLRKSDFDETGTSVMDTEGFSHNIMSLASVELGMVFVQSERGIKISFRSKDKPSVNEIAKKFGGGGHKNASGAFVENQNLEEVIKEVLQTSKEYLT